MPNLIKPSNDRAIEATWNYSSGLMPLSNTTNMQKTILTHDSKFKMVIVIPPVVTILCGIPTSGKSTWAKERTIDALINDSIVATPITICRDTIRLGKVKSGKYGDIKFSKELEKEVTAAFNECLQIGIKNNVSMIIDQTNCNEKYLKALLKTFESTNYSVKIVFFDIPLWKAYYRNIIRNWKTGKWIPIKVLKTMKNNYDKINKNDYICYQW